MLIPRFSPKCSYAFAIFNLITVLESKLLFLFQRTSIITDMYFNRKDWYIQTTYVVTFFTITTSHRFFFLLITYAKYTIVLFIAMYDVIIHGYLLMTVFVYVHTVHILINSQNQSIVDQSKR